MSIPELRYDITEVNDRLIQLIDHWIDNVRSCIDSGDDDYITESAVLYMITGMVNAIEESGDVHSQYNIPPVLKRFLLLIRDSKLQEEKANVRFLLNQVNVLDYKDYKWSLFTNLVAAGVHVKNQVRSLYKLNLSKEDLEWYNEVNTPWTTYRSQFFAIYDQINQIKESYDDLLVLNSRIGEIISLFEENLSHSQKVIELADGSIRSLKKVAVQEYKDVFSLLSDCQLINATVQKYPTIPNNLDVEVERLIGESKEKFSIPVDTVGGQIEVKSLMLRSRLKDWLHIELLPEVYEIWEVVEEVVSIIKSGSENILNRLTLIQKSEEKEHNFQFLKKSVKRINELSTNNIQHTKSQIEYLRHKMLSNLSVIAIMDSSVEFLPSNRGSRIDTASIEESPLVKGMKNVFEAGRVRINRYLDTLLDDHNPSASELLINQLKDTQLNKHNEYNSIFLTKSFSGKSFYVHREEKEAVVANAIELWLKGYRGGLLVTGTRFSGKSTFSSAILTNHKEMPSVKLEAGKELFYNGRNLAPTHNLEEALKFVKKYYADTKTIILIDDLFSWQDQKTNFVTNVKALLKFIDYNHSRYFVITALDRCQLEHFDKNLNISKSFNSLIDVSELKLDEFYRIIDVRHGATHKNMIYGDHQLVLPELFKKYIKMVYRECEANVGDGLRLWALGVYEDDGNVRFSKRNGVELPDFFDENNTILLKAIALNRHTSEYRLRNILGPSFNEKYKDILMRMISIGIIQRDIYNNLVFNESIANQICDKLKSEGYL